jgi:hypothetical protein
MSHAGRDDYQVRIQCLPADFAPRATLLGGMQNGRRLGARGKRSGEDSAQLGPGHRGQSRTRLRAILPRAGRPHKPALPLAAGNGRC